MWWFIAICIPLFAISFLYQLFTNKQFLESRLGKKIALLRIFSTVLHTSNDNFTEQTNILLTKSCYGYLVNSNNDWKPISPHEPYPKFGTWDSCPYKSLWITYYDYVHKYHKPEEREHLLQIFTDKGQPGECFAQKKNEFKEQMQKKEIPYSFLKHILNAKRSIAISFHTFDTKMDVIMDAFDRAKRNWKIDKDREVMNVIARFNENEDTTEVWYHIPSSYFLTHFYDTSCLNKDTIFIVQEDYKRWIKHNKNPTYGKNAYFSQDWFYWQTWFVVIQTCILDDTKQVWNVSSLDGFNLVNPYYAACDNNYYKLENLKTTPLSQSIAFWVYVIIVSCCFWFILLFPIFCLEVLIVMMLASCFTILSGRLVAC